MYYLEIDSILQDVKYASNATELCRGEEVW